LLLFRLGEDIKSPIKKLRCAIDNVKINVRLTAASYLPLTRKIKEIITDNVTIIF
jgi:hypothetical protein